jgi:dTDP-4-dehydrorhamnose 3,5-epimerase
MPISYDDRGYFVKTFRRDRFEGRNLRVDFAEEYYTFSRRNVLRGLHFQLPPAGQAKIVYCVNGEVLDVLVDIRRGSPTYGKHEMFNLTSEVPTGLYMPEGFAHGFCVLSETATLAYKVTSLYASKLDSGIRWDSVGIDWPQSNFIVSDRDTALPSFVDFATPFVYNGT